jgi:hypothetical protein
MVTGTQDMLKLSKVMLTFLMVPRHAKSLDIPRGPIDTVWDDMLTPPRHGKCIQDYDNSLPVYTKRFTKHGKSIWIHGRRLPRYSHKLTTHDNRLPSHANVLKNMLTVTLYMVNVSSIMLKVYLGTLIGLLTMVRVSEDTFAGSQDMVTGSQNMLTGSQYIVDIPWTKVNSKCLQKHHTCHSGHSDTCEHTPKTCYLAPNTLINQYINCPSSW